MRRVNYGAFDSVRAGDGRGEAAYTSALNDMMTLYEAEAKRRGGLAKDKVALEAITDDIPKVYKAFMARALDTERIRGTAPPCKLVSPPSQRQTTGPTGGAPRPEI